MPNSQLCLVRGCYAHRRRYRPFQGGAASRLATAIYVAMATTILYDNSYSLNDLNLKYESGLMVDFFKKSNFVKVAR